MLVFTILGFYDASMMIWNRILGLSPRTLLLLCAGFSVVALASALVGQYVFGLHPCDLCIYQRIPYTLITVMGFAGAFFAEKPKAYYILLTLCAALFLVDAGIATYHTGVEYGVFAGPTACSNADEGEQTLEEMRAAIMNAPLVTCAQAMAYFAGLSMAAWNALAASAGFVGLVLVLRHKRKIRYEA